jgi:hypothetical protein
LTCKGKPNVFGVEVCVRFEIRRAEEVVNADREPKLETHLIDVVLALASGLRSGCVLRVCHDVIDFVEEAPPDIKSSARFCISSQAVKICEVNEYNVRRRSRRFPANPAATNNTTESHVGS